MRIVFMGTPDFAVPSLQALLDAGHEVGLVVTQPDAARGRGKKIRFSPVKNSGLKAGAEILQPVKVKGNGTFLQRIREYDPELMVVAAYGQILPEEVLNLPPLGCINVHASLLPRHRGAAPIQRAILDGDQVTGVTIMQMAEALDAGDILARAEAEVDHKTAGQLHNELAELGAALLTDTIPRIANGTIRPVPQDDAMATYAPMIFRQDGQIDFSDSPEVIERQIRGMNPWPGAFTSYRENIMKIWAARVGTQQSSRPAGSILNASDDGIVIACGGGSLVAEVIQMPGKRKMSAAEWLRGHKIDKSLVLG